MCVYIIFHYMCMTLPCQSYTKVVHHEYINVKMSIFCMQKKKKIIPWSSPCRPLLHDIDSFMQIPKQPRERVVERE